MRGFGSLIGIVIASLITVLLVVFYLKSNMPSAPEMEQKHGAIDQARSAAKATEEVQQRQFQQLEDAAKEK
jgi:hypothetical protein